MARVIIARSLEHDVRKRFKADSVKIFSLMYSLKERPKKGKIVGTVGDLVVKEIKFRSHRFYFITNGYKVKFLDTEELADMLVKFVRMSDKKEQKRVIQEIKSVLRTLGPRGFA